MKRKKYFLKLLFLSLLFLVISPINVFAQADPYGVNDLGVVLDQDLDPKSSLVNIINIALGFLGLIAVIIVIYGGFVWMTSGGEAEKVNKAKQILKNGLIGLIIVLASWGITIFIISQFAGGGGGSGGNTCNPGETETDFVCNDINGVDCYKNRTCSASGTWGSWVNTCSCLGGGTGDPCDREILTAGCQADDTMCSPNHYCDSNCTCQSLGGLGDPCSSDPDPNVCAPSDQLCGQYLFCDTDCTCQGPPVITSISPVGGFCNDGVDEPCETDADCSSGLCNIDTPNGNEDNLITILGHNFGSYDPASSTVLFYNNLEGVLPENLNPECDNTWTNNQIVIAIPGGIATSGPISVEARNQTGTTDDGIGPNIPDFQPNTINRPGLCKVDPDEGRMEDEIEYQGVNLFNTSKARFGLYNSNVVALNNSFSHVDALEGTAEVPNVNSGLISTFVRGTVGGFSFNSNYLNFTKNPEESPGPYISSFSPVEGNIGQYVSIYGGGFGDNKGANQVFFDNTEANYQFPDVCLHSVWSDNLVIVKVPDTIADGDYTIKMKIGSEEINTTNLTPNFFTVSSTLPLAPSLCKISPIRGQAGTNVSLWGEYFGNTSDPVKAIFHNNKVHNSNVSQQNNADTFSVSLDSEVISGPVKVEDNSGVSGNSLNFEVGPCASDADCGAEKCCPAGSDKEFRCEANLSDCSINVPSSVFEWKFSTDFEETIVNPPPNSDSCAGLAKNLFACPVEQFCPNSPGLCGVTQFENKQVGVCDYDCLTCGGILEVESVGTCDFNQNIDRCVHNIEICSLNDNFTYTLGASIYNTTKVCQYFSNPPSVDPDNYWQIKVSTSCPDDWINMGGGYCVLFDINETCDLCPSGFNCLDIDGDGRCASNKLCPSGITCDADGKCIQEVGDACECCCRVNNSEQDCCFPTVCEPGCGESLDKGYCTNCAVYTDPDDPSTFLQGESNDACNCSGHSGKICDISSNTKGICVDCANLGEDECKENADVCCYDDMANICRGGEAIDSGADVGYCPYYNCSGANCDLTQVKQGLYFDMNFCQEDCPNNPNSNFCNNIDNYTDCRGEGNCCWDDALSNCQSTIIEDRDKTTLGYCAYYNCDLTGDTCDNTPILDGHFTSTTTCAVACNPFTQGVSCFNNTSNSCQTSLCHPNFSCVDSDGELGDISGDCGTCCCDPNTLFGEPNPCDFWETGDDALVCVEDQDPCDGAERGLCCGCEEDNECGNNNVGCSFDTCCRARPKVVDNYPGNGDTGICRNASVSVEFDQIMHIPSLAGKIMLLEERDYNNGPCPSGTFVLEDSRLKKIRSGFFGQIIASVNNLWSKVFNRNKVNTALAIDSTKLYCLVPGTIQIEQLPERTKVHYHPNRLLADDTKHFIVVKGDNDLNSLSGVLSYWGVGMNGDENPEINEVEYNNSFYSYFTTLSDQSTNAGVCEVAYVSVSPSSYLFNTHNNDVNEEDGNANDSSFDTERDKDKVFLATARSYDGQPLSPVANYDWDWDWDYNVDMFTSSNVVSGNKIFLSVKNTVFDARDILTATAEMDTLNEINTDDVSGSANLFVFICNNPWPPMHPVNHHWEPWKDTKFKYEVYYCRDGGGQSLADDLPAVINEPIERDLLESVKVCSNSNKTCENNDDCEGGICIEKFLKEAYFFRQTKPSGGEITAVSNKETGGKAMGKTIEIFWVADKNLIYHSTSSALTGKFRIYYAKESDGDFTYDTISATSTLCNATANKYICSDYEISDLENDQPYIFKGSAITWNNIETFFSNEKIFTPKDELVPPQPTDCDYEFNESLARLEFSCEVDYDTHPYNNLPFTDSFHFLRLYYGVSSGKYGESIDGAIGSLNIPLNLSSLDPERDYYFAISAFDESGNKSDYSDEIDINSSDLQNYVASSTPSFF